MTLVQVSRTVDLTFLFIEWILGNQICAWLLVFSAVVHLLKCYRFRNNTYQSSVSDAGISDQYFVSLAFWSEKVNFCDFQRFVKRLLWIDLPSLHITCICVSDIASKNDFKVGYLWCGENRTMGFSSDQKFLSNAKAGIIPNNLIFSI